MKKIIYIASMLCIVSSCSLYKTFKTPEPQIDNICGTEVAMEQDTTVILPTIKMMFSDKSLQELLEIGLKSNSDLQVARLNIEQSEALLRSAKLAYLPSLAFAPQGGVNKALDFKPQYSYNLPLTAQWELDIFGKIRNSKEQARAAMLQSVEYSDMVQTQIVASIANVYYTLIMLDEQLSITRQNIDIQRQNLDIISAMKDAGMQTETAVNQAAAAYYSIQTSAQDLETQIKVVENSMALLLNQTPGRISRSTMSSAGIVNIDHNKAIPLVFLANRPDVKSAEYELSRSFYGINVARAAFYPSVSLSGTLGWTNNLGSIVNPGSMLLSAIGSLVQPIFNRGVNKANLKIAKVQYEQSLIKFEKTLLVAGNEVNDALLACQNSAAKKMLRDKQVVASELALANSTELMKHSSTTYLEILMAQSSLLNSKLSQVADWAEGIQGQISLFKALGAGVDIN